MPAVLVGQGSDPATHGRAANGAGRVACSRATPGFGRRLRRSARRC